MEDFKTGELIGSRCAAVDDESLSIEHRSNIGLTNKWGKKQRNYYGTSYVDKDFGGVNDAEEEEMLQLEEEDAKARQEKIESANSLVDFECLIGYSEENDNGKKLFEVLDITPVNQAPEKVIADGKLRENIDGAMEQKELFDSQSETAVERGKNNNTIHCIPLEKRRKINYEIRKNKGMRKDKGRKKTKQRHSRVMKRTQYEKALMKRRSQVPNMRCEMERYNGEKRGIRVSTIRSIKF